MKCGITLVRIPCVMLRSTLYWCSYTAVETSYQKVRSQKWCQNDFVWKTENATINSRMCKYVPTRVAGQKKKNSSWVTWTEHVVKDSLREVLAPSRLNCAVRSPAKCGIDCSSVQRGRAVDSGMSCETARLMLSYWSGLLFVYASMLAANLWVLCHLRHADCHWLKPVWVRLLSLSRNKDILLNQNFSLVFDRMQLSKDTANFIDYRLYDV